MSGIGVDIKVNRQQLLDAKKAAEDLKKNLRDVAAAPVNIRITEPKQMDENLFPQRHVSVADVARQNQVLSKSVNDFIQESRRSSWRDSYSIRPPSPPFPPTPPGGGRDTGDGFFRRSLRWGGRVAGYGAALAGGFSLLSLLHESTTQAANYGGGEADLIMRGGNDRFRRNAMLMGYTPEEALHIQDTIGKNTGFGNSRLNDASYSAAYYGRLMGIPGAMVAGYIGASFPATGASVGEYEKQLKYLRDTAVALGARGRIEEVLKNNQQIMAHVVQGRGGKEFSDLERMQMLSMQMGLWATPGQIGKGQSGANLLGTVDQGIRNGGNSPGSKIFLAQALGVENVNSMKDLWTFNKRMSEGGSARNIKAVLDYSEKIATQRGLSPDDAKIFAMMNIRDSLGLNENQTEAIFSSAFRKSLDASMKYSPETAMKAFMHTKRGKANLQAASTDPFSLRGNAHRRTVAEFTNTEVDLGGKVLPYVDKLKNAVTRSYSAAEKGDYLGSFTEALKDNPLGKLMVLGMGLNLASKLPVPPFVPVPKKFIPPIVPVGKILAPTTAFIGTMAPKNDQVGEDAISKVINRGGSPAEIHQAAQEQAEKNHGGGGLLESLHELIDLLRVWLHKMNNDPIPTPPRFRERN
ncbi:hypothetical protein GURASL_30250 [Geotalea uraniireducens]|uniref:Uncharacterized protein n=1 Tax=Geotalea uraniireducens TaxID=351604 RepID=A0ABM8ENC3_9BACT|nr:hypothetical protein [Geotalea uraniireducens]BDV44102.1 hypothetical protein GURASL_30250 [Geotalea uraniireducens]